MSRFQAQPTPVLDEQLANWRENKNADLLSELAEVASWVIHLTEAEVERLAGILDRGFSPTPALRRALSRLSDPKRRPPRLRWKETTA